MAGRIEAKLAALGIELPPPPAPIASYVGFNVVETAADLGRRGALVVVSGQIPLVEGKLAFIGKLGTPIDSKHGRAISIEQGQQAARLCFVNLMAQLKAACGGDLDKVKRVVRLGGFIACGPDFTQHALVMNGASDLAVEVFGEAGKHARTTIGVPSLPADAPVEVEGMFELG